MIADKKNSSVSPVFSPSTTFFSSPNVTPIKFKSPSPDGKPYARKSQPPYAQKSPPPYAQKSPPPNSSNSSSTTEASQDAGHSPTSSEAAAGDLGWLTQQQMEINHKSKKKRKPNLYLQSITINNYHSPLKDISNQESSGEEPS